MPSQRGGRQVVPWIMFAAAMALLAAVFFSPKAGREMPWQDFMNLASTGGIDRSSVVVESSRVTAKVTPNTAGITDKTVFANILPQQSYYIDDLTKQGIAFTVVETSQWPLVILGILPYILVIGVIIFISAGLSWLPYTLQVHAGAAKAGIDNMMKNLALEWGIYGIRCNSIAPGYIGETEGTSKLAGGPVLEAVLESTPLGRLGTVDDIGQAAVFLASPLASFITGTIAVVDGGHYLGGSSLLNSAQRKVAAATASGSTS